MARPTTPSLNFISVDTQFYRKMDRMGISRLEASVFQSILFLIADEKGNYCVFDDNLRKSFKRENELTNEYIDSLLETLFSKDLLNRKLFEEYHVLTSVDIQDRYLAMAQKKAEVVYIQEYLLIDLDKRSQTVTRHVIIKDKSGKILRDFTKQPSKHDKQPRPGQPKQKETKKQQQPAEPKPNLLAQAGRQLNGYDDINNSDNTPVIPLTPPQPPAPPKPSGSPVTDYLAAHVREFIKVPYNDRPPEFKEQYSEELYDAYRVFNHMIDFRYAAIRASYRQLTFELYAVFMEEEKPTDDQLKEALAKITAKGLNKSVDIYGSLVTAMKQVKNPFVIGNKPHAQQNKPLKKGRLLTAND